MSEQQQNDQPFDTELSYFTKIYIFKLTKRFYKTLGCV